MSDPWPKDQNPDAASSALAVLAGALDETMGCVSGWDEAYTLLSTFRDGVGKLRSAADHERFKRRRPDLAGKGEV